MAAWNCCFLQRRTSNPRVGPRGAEAWLRVVDLSGAWRLVDARNRAVYAFGDEGSAVAVTTQAKAVTGCLTASQGDRERELVANPGCYATSVILGVRPLVAAEIVDVRTG